LISKMERAFEREDRSPWGGPEPGVEPGVAAEARATGQGSKGPVRHHDLGVQGGMTFITDNKGEDDGHRTDVR